MEIIVTEKCNIKFNNTILKKFINVSDQLYINNLLYNNINYRIKIKTISGKTKNLYLLNVMFCQSRRF